MTATLTDTDILTDFDFDPEHAEPCEFPDHDSNHPGDGPAEWRVLRLCPGCHQPRVVLICDGGKEYLLGVGLVDCMDCGHIAPWADFVLFLERLT